MIRVLKSTAIIPYERQRWPRLLRMRVAGIRAIYPRIVGDIIVIIITSILANFLGIP